jgi:integrating conjugative element membrane protein (TIGR03747 family)
MAEPKAHAPRREEPPGLLAGTFAFAMKLVHGLLAALLLALIVECVGMAWWWPEEGTAHSRRLLDEESKYLGATFRRHLFVHEPPRFAERVATRLTHVVYELTGLARVHDWATTPPGPNEPGPKAYVHRFANRLAGYLLCVRQTAQLFGLRLAVIVLALPSVLLCGLVAAVDGLVSRDLRRWGGGRESGFVYHWAKRLALPLSVGIWGIYLALPVSLAPPLIVVPFSLVLGLFVAATVGAFKKYL